MDRVKDKRARTTDGEFSIFKWVICFLGIQFKCMLFCLSESTLFYSEEQEACMFYTNLQTMMWELLRIF